MNRAMTKERIAEMSARFQARIALIYYLLVIVTGVVIFLVGNRLGFFVDVIATAFILSVTALFYALTRRV
ncbi:MAG TPA: hypothetical protein VKB47_17045 [Terracidiphilus sp.]|nr:hypothetical protein [Terracidiphilus sp.]